MVKKNQWYIKVIINNTTYNFVIRKLTHVKHIIKNVQYLEHNITSFTSSNTAYRQCIITNCFLAVFNGEDQWLVWSPLVVDAGQNGYGGAGQTIYMDHSVIRCNIESRNSWDWISIRITNCPVINDVLTTVREWWKGPNAIPVIDMVDKGVRPPGSPSQTQPNSQPAIVMSTMK